MNAGVVIVARILFSIVFTLTLAAQNLTAQTLERGKEHFRAGRYVDAIEDLRAAAAAALTPEARQAYVATGKIDTLAELEESLVYLALTYDRIGREAEARDAVTRLLNAERISPTFAKLPLSSDAVAFEALAARLVPSIPLVANEKLAAVRGAAPLGIVVQPTLAQQRAEMVKLIDERVAAARAEIEKSANARIAEERAAAQKMADERVAVETAAAMKAAEEKIASERTAARAAAMKSADEKIAAERAAAEQRVQERIAAERSAAMKSAEERIASERAAAEQRAQERIASERANAERETSARIASERAAAEKRAEERVASERANAMKSAEQKITSERAAAEKRAEERIANERAAAMRSADEKIAAERIAADRETAAKIATARVEVEKAAEEKIARERTAMQRVSEERIAVERASAEKAAQERIAAAEAERRRALLLSLRQAETFAIAGQLEDANRIYVALAQSPQSTREAIAAAAAGLYRTGGFAEAVRAFTRLGKFAAGEDDLRYYYAVSLYEIGKYDEAKTELAAALPNLQRTDDVERYRAKIEQSASAQVRR